MSGTFEAYHPALGFKRLLALLRRDALPLILACGAWCGALGFYLWPTEPSWYRGLLGLGVALILWPFKRVRGGATALLAGTFFFLLSYLELVNTTPPAWALLQGQSRWMVAQVQEIVPQAQNPKRATLRVAPVHIVNLPRHAQPSALRLGVWKSQLGALQVGDKIAVPIQLISPQGPQMPGQRDGRFWAWFNPTLTPAFTVGQLEPTTDAMGFLNQEHTQWDKFAERIAGWREHIVAQTQTLAGGVPTALLVGVQDGISPALRQAYQAAGISHLLAISGMQLTLVGVGMFWLLRWLGATMPVVALRFPLKHIAALGALVAVGVYTLLTGAAPSIIRAACMVALVLFAVLAGRTRGLVRGWAWANVAILAMQPHLAMSAGLQLSVCATLGLALWASYAPRPHGVFAWFKAGLWATLLAGAFTAPLSVLHFGTAPALGLLGNVVAIPLMTLASYAGFTALALWPLGLEVLGLVPLAWLSQGVTQWAYFVAALQPVQPPLLPSWIALPLGCIALLSLLFMLSQMYRAAVVLTVATMVGLMLWSLVASRPELLVAENGIAAWRVSYTEAVPNYRLIWSEDMATAQRLHRRLTPEYSKKFNDLPCCADAQLMPPVATFAFAERNANGDWQITPQRCARRWQQASQSCQQ